MDITKATERFSTCSTAFRHSSNLTGVSDWKHVNLNGEYDFSDEQMVDSVGLEATLKILDLNLV